MVIRYTTFVHLLPIQILTSNLTFCTLQAHRPDGSVAIAEYTLHVKNNTYSSHNLFISDHNLSYLCDWLSILDIDLRTHTKESQHSQHWSQRSDLHKYLPLLVPDNGRLYNDHCQEDHHCCNGYSCHCPSSCALSGCGFSLELNIYTQLLHVLPQCAQHWKFITYDHTRYLSHTGDVHCTLFSLLWTNRHST